MNVAPSDLLCLVVSLRRSDDRRRSIRAALGALDIDFEFVDAVDGRCVLEPDVERRIVRGGPGGRGLVTDAELACALSHRRAYERFLQTDAAFALVLEDDALPTAALRRFLIEGHYRRWPVCLPFHSRARVFRHGAEIVFDVVRAHRLALPCTGAVACTLDRDAARALRAANDPIARLADWPMDLSALGARVLLPTLVGHSTADADRSLLAACRATVERQRDHGRYLRAGYLGRRWLKLVSTRVS